MIQPLTGIKVLDFTRAGVGPSATQVLGDMGADVYKIESIGYGDFLRHLQVMEELNGESAAFLGFNRNKKSICIDLRHPEGKEIIFKLVKICDIVVQNFRPGVMQRLGFDYEILKQYNPGIIYASGSGYGLTGPYVNKGGQDLVGQAVSGMPWLTGNRNGPPCPTGTPIGDWMCGMLIAQGVLAALFLRERTGEGQKVSVCILDGLLPPQADWLNYYLNSKSPRQPPKFTSPLYRFYRTKDDKWLEVSGAFDRNTLADICKVLGLPDLSQEERFKNAAEWFTKDSKSADELEEILAERFLNKSRDEWIKLLEEEDILCGPVNDYDDLVRDPQVVHNDMIIEYDHPRAGRVRTAGMPVKFSKTPCQLRLPPPILGQHTNEILNMLGYSQEKIEELRDKKVVD